MKRFLTTAVLALCVAAISTHQATAWVNSKFGVGLNWCYQAGGNELLFGLIRCGQPPAPDCAVGAPAYVPGPAPCPNGGGHPFGGGHGLLTPPQNGMGAGQDASAASLQSRQNYNRYYNTQNVNYQYPYYYNNYYYGYGR